MRRIIGSTILHYDEVTSTNDLARARAEEGEAEGLVISAERQTAGRGRMGRSWTVPPRSSIQISVLLRPALPPLSASGIVQMACLAAGAALREAAAQAERDRPGIVALKWPNDVLLNGKKCAGILVETSVENERLKYVIVGLGINVNYTMQEYPSLAGFATTLADELGHVVDRTALLDSLLNKLDDYYYRFCSGKAGEALVFHEWRSQMATLGQTVQIATPSGIEEGIAIDVGEDGALLLRRQNDLIKIYSGDVTVLKRLDQRSLE
jgi:BirA family transcriptional regulator, biotin operon repressor / biotin---[acetyl-CoA-carboxylase] ligase